MTAADLHIMFVFQEERKRENRKGQRDVPAVTITFIRNTKYFPEPTPSRPLLSTHWRDLGHVVTLHYKEGNVTCHPEQNHSC
jgi:hypothetical protein